MASSGTQVEPLGQLVSTGKLTAPVVQPVSSMSKAAYKRFRRWEAWLLTKALILYHTGILNLPEANDRYQEVYNSFCALHGGALIAVSEDGGASILDGMPETPAVWPEEFPHQLANAFLTYLLELEAAESLNSVV